MEFNTFIQQFAERVGIETPEMVDDAVAFDADGMPLLLMRIVNEGESEYLVIAADLGEPPPERMEKLYEALLDAGHAFAGAGGGVFARNPADGHIWLQLREAYASIDVESAIAKVKNAFVQALKNAGVDEGALEKVRAELGLPQSGSTRGFDISSLKPLTRAQTREFQITGLGSGNPQIASLGVRQDIEALDK